jgi:RHS repeat-associated protein
VGVTSILVNEGIKPVQITDPVGAVTKYQYDSGFNLIGTIDALGRPRSFSYDGNGNPIKTIDAAGNQSSMTYDPIFNQLTTFTDNRGNVTTFVLDNNGNVTSQVYPDKTFESYSYGQAGLLSQTDAKGQTTTYSYTPSGQLLSRTYPDHTSATYSYDAEGNLISAADSTGTITQTYDAGNRLVSKTYPGSRTLQYKYNSGGQRIQLTDADGQMTSYTYDADGRLSQLLNSVGQAIVSYQYDALGRVSQKTLANGALAQYTYDLASRIQRISNNSPSGSAISFFAYTYDAAGDVLSKSTVEGLEQYTYDVLGQLTGVSYPNGTSAQYVYDSAGNRTSATEGGVQSAYITNNRNEYQSVGSTAFSYDANGNTTGQTPVPSVPYSYSYDYRNRLIQAQTPSASVSYTYNALGERSSRTDQSGTVQYLWDGLALLTEQSPAYQTVARYTWGKLLDEAVAMTRNGSNYYYTQDALMSVSDLLDANGHTDEHYTYSAFGTPSRSSAAGNPFFFTGARYDQTTSLHSFRARWYSPGLGRFITADPIGILGGSNRYAYAGNAPSIYTDPVGLSFATSAIEYWGDLGSAYDLAAGFAEQHPVGAVVGLFASVAAASEIGTATVLGAVASAIYSWAVGSLAETLFNMLQDGAVALFSDGTGASAGSSSSGAAGGAPIVFGGGGAGGGGTCPTFVQLLPGSVHADLPKPVNQSLFGKIAIPMDNALLRSDIPIYGVAGGTDFEKYRVEYGEGKKPAKWTLIQSSTTPQPTNTVGMADIQLMQGDMDLRGNLATWNTGLKEWVHLPWHPADDPTDLRGEYTVRIVVTGKDGRSVEDRFTAEVGRVISQVLSGDAISTDSRVTMHFEAQSLQAPFRVYTIKPLINVVPPIPAGLEMAGSAYTVREPGDQFLKPVVLRFDVGGKTSGLPLSEFAIYSYDANDRQWKPIPTSQGSRANTLEASIFALPTPVAYFAVLHGPGNRSLPASAVKRAVSKRAAGIPDTLLVFDTFESNLGEWAARDRAFGGTVSRDQSAQDRTYSLKITNHNSGGNFAVTAVSSPFRADIYPIVNFDYRIGPGVKTDFYVRVAQTWYRIGFTGDEGEFRNADLGISPIGHIEGIVSDGQWHAASFDLNRMLATKTARRDVEEIVMANWRVGGYMKLEFGKNARGAAYYIDNFKIRRGDMTGIDAEEAPTSLLVDDFEGARLLNRLGGAYDVFSNPGAQNVSMKLVAAANASDRKRAQALVLNFDVTRTGSYGGYWSRLRGAPGDNFDQLVLNVKSPGKWTGFLVGLKRGDGVEPKVPAERYWGPVAADGWRKVAIPLAAFGAPRALSALDTFSISFTNELGHGKGELLVDDVRFERGLSSALIADFEEGTENNRLTQKNWIFTRGAAALAAGAQRPDSVPGSRSLRLSYGGTIGLDLGSGDFSYAGWVAGLGGLNASRAGALQFRVRGQAGGERFNVYLDDGTRRKSVDLSKYATVTKDWKEVSIPLDLFAGQGVDLTHLEELQFVFEWQQMSGTVYLDDIRLSPPELIGK